jgi:hypothetical protein
MDQRDVFVALGVNAARDTRCRVGYAVDFHEGDHWIELVVLPTRDDAKAAIERAVAKGASPAHQRVRRVHAED